MKRLLLVAPHFAPSNAPDGHRARLLLPHLAAHGWTATVLSVRPEYVDAPREPELLQTLPPDADVRRVGALPRAARRVGLGTLGWRSLAALDRAGRQALRERACDLVYFSTSQFPSLLLAHRWRRLHGVPYVVDLQDPWVNEFYRRPGAPPPPGGWKYWVNQWLARRAEARTLRHAAHLVTVSSAYPQQLAARYAWFDPAAATTLPFGWSAQDFLVAERVYPTPDLPASPHVLYQGRVGADMMRLLDALFGTYAAWRERHPELPPIRWSFRGTSYAANGGPGVVKAAAARHGLADVVDEAPGRSRYLEALARLRRSDSNLVLGSDDRSYSPSKLWPTLASGRPWLVVAPAGSVLAGLVEPLATGGRLIRLGEKLEAEDLRQLELWFDLLVRRQLPVPVIHPQLQELSAEALASRHAALFNRLVRA